MSTNSISVLVDDIFKRLNSLKERNLELEVRLGKINDLQTDNRIFLPSKTPVIFYENKIYKFTPGVSVLDFEFFVKKLKKLSEESKKEIDDFKDRQIITKQARITIRDDKIAECILKTKIVTFDLYLPDCLYDIRISISDEAKSKNSYDIESLKYEERTNKYLFKRERKRLSLESEDRFYDLTKVKMSDYEANEVEIELKKEHLGDKEKISDFIKSSMTFLERK